MPHVATRKSCCLSPGMQIFNSFTCESWRYRLVFCSVSVVVSLLRFGPAATRAAPLSLAIALPCLVPVFFELSSVFQLPCSSFQLLDQKKPVSFHKNFAIARHVHVCMCVCVFLVVVVAFCFVFVFVLALFV